MARTIALNGVGISGAVRKSMAAWLSLCVALRYSCRVLPADMYFGMVGRFVVLQRTCLCRRLYSLTKMGWMEKRIGTAISTVLEDHSMQNETFG